MKDVLEKICIAYNVAPGSIFMRSRKRRISDARLMYILMNPSGTLVENAWSTSELTNILKRAYSLLEVDGTFAAIYKDITQGVYNSYEHYFKRKPTGETYYFLRRNRVCKAIDNDDYMAYKRHLYGNYFFTAEELYKSRRSKL